jgi:hypothetical protein
LLGEEAQPDFARIGGALLALFRSVAVAKRCRDRFGLPRALEQVLGERLEHRLRRAQQEPGIERGLGIGLAGLLVEL